MISLDLFDSKYEKGLHEGAVDKLEQHRIDVLNDRMQELLARARTADAGMKASLKQQYDKIKAERDSYYRIREAQRGQDVVDRGAKMKALTPAKPGTVGAVRDVAQGLKNFLQGRPEKGPTYESQKKNLNLSKGVIPTEPLPETGGGWALDPRTRLELQQRRQRNRTIARHAGRPVDDASAYERRVSELEAQGLTRSDAQGVADAEQMQGRLREHGGGIGPKQRWQDLMKNEGWSDKHNPTPYAVYIDGREWKVFSDDEHARAVAEKVRASLARQGRNQKVTIAPSQEYLNKKISEQELVEGIRDTAGATAVIACLLAGGGLTGCATAPEKTTAQQVLKTGQDLGRTVQTAQRITRAGVEAEVNQEIRNLLRGMGGRPQELNHSNILRIWRRINQPQNQDQNEAKHQPASLEESDNSNQAEQAILRRIFVAHKDLLLKYGPNKVMQAAEDVAYNVGDQEIGSSDVSGWVRQVEQILGARP